jgi:hypothetical protein
MLMLWFGMHNDTLYSKLNYSSRFFTSFSSFYAAKFLKDGTQLLIGNITGATERWSSEGGERPNRWITSVGSGIRPRIFPVAEAFLNDQLIYISAITSDGTSYHYAL